MAKQPFRFAYIDAFAGIGLREPIKRELPPLFPELIDARAQGYLEGSARIALKVQPRFHKDIFIEHNQKRAARLAQVRNDFPDKAKDIEIVNADANTFLADRCENYSWINLRAVLFLDPFGMEVDWKTIEAIARKKAIDLWILFPLGVAVNRLLRTDGRIDSSVKNKLTRFWGTEEWFELFYRQENLPLLNGAPSDGKSQLILTV
jgi:three-Cys-motif partner protein